MRASSIFLTGVGLICMSVVMFVLWGGLDRALAPRVTMEDAREAMTGRAPTSPQEYQTLEQAAEAGDPTAMNNLGVALWRSRKPGDKEAARALFEKAAAAGDIPARYNLALMLPDRFDTDPEIIQRRLALLRQNVDAGDIHSMVALAESLYYVNRDRFVDDREGMIRRLLRTAASSGDPDYLFIYGNTLWRQIRGEAENAGVTEALAALLLAWEKGEARGAEAIGDILSGGQPGLAAAVAHSGIETDPLLWYRRAGDAGLASARCHYGLKLFRTKEWISDPDMGLVERHFRAGPAVLGNDEEAVARAIADLEFCAQPPKRTRRPNPPFGEGSLYAYKLRGGWTAMVTEPGWANVVLGVLHGYGIAVPRDRTRAVRYLDIAADKHDFDVARALRDSLPDF